MPNKNVIAFHFTDEKKKKKEEKNERKETQYTSSIYLLTPTIIVTHEHNAKFTVAAHHPFRHAVGYSCTPVTSLIAISPFFLFQLFFPCSYLARPLLVYRFLPVIFLPPGNYVGAVDQTREGAAVAKKKVVLHI